MVQSRGSTPLHGAIFMFHFKTMFIMKRITSINNAIKYFSQNTKVEIRKDSKGREYKVFIPPAGFHHMNVSEHLLDIHGRLGGVITEQFCSGQWRDYVTYLCRMKDRISKLVLYYED